MNKASRRNTGVLTSCAALAACVLLAAGCGSAASSVPVPQQPAQSNNPGELIIATPVALPAMSGLPALPELGDSRGVSCDFSTVLRLGNETYLNSAAAIIDDGQALALLPAAERDLNWAVYGFSGFDPDKDPSAINLWLFDPTDQILYIGVADYGLGKWSFLGAQITDREGQVAQARYELNNNPNFRSPSGAIYLAVVTYDSASIEVHNCRLQFGVRDIWVQGLTATQDQIEQTTIGWTPVPDAIGYEVWYRFLNFPGSSLFLTETGVPGFVHSVDEPPGKEVDTAEPYMYFVAAKFADGYCSQLTGYAIGIAQPAP